MSNLFKHFFKIDGAPFEPSDLRSVEMIMELANPHNEDIAVDLGSGDGRIVIELAERCKTTYGIEIDRYLAFKSIKNIEENKITNAFIFNADFWKFDLSSFNLITVFQIDSIMERLESKLLKELKPGARVVSHHWKFPNLEIKKQIEDIYLYEI